MFGDDDRGLLTLGRGLAGRLELSVELHDETDRNDGAGRALIGAGLAVAAPGDLVWAQVSPGNAASLRAFLACGFVPIGSEVLLSHAERASRLRVAVEFQSRDTGCPAVAAPTVAWSNNRVIRPNQGAGRAPLWSGREWATTS